MFFQDKPLDLRAFESPRTEIEIYEQLDGFKLSQGCGVGGGTTPSAPPPLHHPLCTTQPAARPSVMSREPWPKGKAPRAHFLVI